MVIEYDKQRPQGVTALMSVSGGDLGDVLSDTRSRLVGAAIAGALGYGISRVFLKGDKPLWAGLAAFGIWLVK